MTQMDIIPLKNKTKYAPDDQLPLSNTAVIFYQDSISKFLDIKKSCERFIVNVHIPTT
jgi:hypothetical protein